MTRERIRAALRAGARTATLALTAWLGVASPGAAQSAVFVQGLVDAGGGLRFPDGTVQTEAAGVGQAPVSDSGQRTCYDPSGDTTSIIACGGTGQDGEVQAGADWPAPRFVDNQDGSVTDRLTGLTWLKDAGCLGPNDLNAALLSASITADGTCNLSDGSSPGDWRLPNIRELLSLVDYSQASPALPPGHPFVNTLAEFYWSSTTFAPLATAAWGLFLAGGNDGTRFKHDDTGRIWPVRGGN